MSNSNQFRGGVKSIQRGVLTIAAGTSSGTATISAVNTAKTELRYLGGSAGSSGGVGLVPRIVLTNSTTLTANYPDSPGAPVSISWELTEFY